MSTHRTIRYYGGSLLGAIFFCGTVLNAPAHVGAHLDTASSASEQPIRLAQVEERPKAVPDSPSRITGQGDWKFRVASEYALPAKAKEHIGGAHGGFAVDPKTKTLYFALKGVGIIRIPPKPGKAEILEGFPQLSQGNLHNVTLFYHQGRPFLSSPDNQQGRVLVVDLERESVKTLGRPAVNAYYQDGNAFNPTDTEFADSTLFVTDGYSNGNYVLQADPFRSAWNESYFGGKGTAHGKFGTCHGITAIPGQAKLAISDRPHSRIERFSVKGKHLSTIALPEGSWPCDIDYHDGYAAVGCLFGSDKSTPAPVYILSREGKVISTLEPKEDLGIANAKHIHNATWWHTPKALRLAVTAWNPGAFFILEHINGE